MARERGRECGGDDLVAPQGVRVGVVAASPKLAVFEGKGFEGKGLVV